MQWSPYQLAIFDFNNQPGNGLINAVAGSGKSTVIEQCVRNAPQDESVLVCAFNRHIKIAMEKRLAGPAASRMGTGCPLTIQTLNGFGYSVCRANSRKYIKINGDKTRNTLKFDVMQGAKDKETGDLFWKINRGVTKLVGLCKSFMYWSPTEHILQELMENFDVKIAKGVDEKQFLVLAARTLELCLEKTTVMDFDDQKAMPIYHNWEFPHFDRVYVDESQDLSPLEIELVRRTTPAKAVFVGDRRQQIYQFRGADSRAIDNIIEAFDCVELPLSVCYRCAKVVVRRAQDQVKHIEAFEGSPEGFEGHVTIDDYRSTVRDGDIILCRTTAPLVAECLELIRRGRRATVKGRDLGTQLVDFMDEIGGYDAMPANAFLELAAYYVETKLPTLTDDRAGVLQDKFDTICALGSRGGTVGDIKHLISNIFDDDIDGGVIYMTGHKAKGLESETVYILRPDLIPHKFARTQDQLDAEYNLWYVMVTRAILNLFWIVENESALPRTELAE